MGVSQFYDAMIKMEGQPKGADDPTYKPPAGHDKELSDSDRAAIVSTSEEAHVKRLKIRHGQDALGKVGGPSYHKLSAVLNKGLD